jgi:hypothetical protein
MGWGRTRGAPALSVVFLLRTGELRSDADGTVRGHFGLLDDDPLCVVVNYGLAEPLSAVFVHAAPVAAGLRRLVKSTQRRATSRIRKR